MRYLIVVTLLWAFSFSLIGQYLAGQVDSDFAVLLRVLIATAVFAPFTLWRGLPGRLVGGFWLAGALQFGITYLCLYRSFSVLTVPEVLLFTVLTPIYVTLFDDALARRFNRWALLALPSFLLFGDAGRLPHTALQWGVLAWMGLFATALGMYWWVKGSVEVSAGTLAIMNELHVPAGLLVNVLIWNRDADLPRLGLGGVVILASLWLNRQGRRGLVAAAG